MRSFLTYQWQAPMSCGGSRSVSTRGFRSSSLSSSVRLPLLQAPKATVSPKSSSAVKPSPFSLSPIPPLHSLSPSSPPPWLLVLSSFFNSLDHNQNQNQLLLDHYPYCFVSLSDNKIFRLDKTQILSQRRLAWDREFFFPDNAEFYGTSPLGWVLVMHPRTLQMYLINPLFPSDSVVSLPPLHDLDTSVVAGSVVKSFVWSDRLVTKYVCWEKTERYDIDPEDNTEMHHIVMDRSLFSPQFAISSPPSHPSCTVLVESRGLLYFWKPGHKSWTEICEPDADYDDGNSIVYSNTRQCFYVLDGTNIDAWKWDSSSPRPRRTRHFEVDFSVEYEIVQWAARRGQYLVESSGGNLWLVEVYCLDKKKIVDAYDPPSLQFFVFELNFEQVKWELVKCLGQGIALFLGTHCCLCARVDDYPELKPNCIYYTNPNIMPLDMVLEFDLGDGTVHPHRSVSNYDPYDAYDCLSRSSIWLLPSTNFSF